MERQYLLVLIFLFQSFILALINLSIWVGQANAFSVKNLANFMFIPNVIIACFTITAVILIRRIVQTIQIEAEERIAIQNIKHLEELIKTMRRQRHDFNHHIATVYGLMEINEQQQAQEYIRNVVEPIIVTAEIMKTDNPVVSALLQVKAGIAEAQKVPINLEVTTSLRGMKIPAYELNIILGNLLDNAFEATTQLEPAQREITLLISETNNVHQFTITNTGAPLSVGELDRFFEYGYTTKTENEGNKGIGLYSAKKLVEKYGGNIKVSTNVNRVSFLVEIPKT